MMNLIKICTNFLKIASMEKASKIQEKKLDN